MISHFSQPLFYFYFITGSLSPAGWLPFKFCQNTRKIYKDLLTCIFPLFIVQ